MLGLAIQEPGSDPFVKIREFRKKHKVTYPLLSDQKAQILSKFGGSGIPANYILDRQGRYVASVDTIEDMVSVLKRLLK